MDEVRRLAESNLYTIHSYDTFCLQTFSALLGSTNTFPGVDLGQ